MWHKLILIAAAGAVGTLSRYALTVFVQRLCGTSFPWGTLAVNVVGCFLFGLVWALSEERLVISGETRFILLTGFMGAFTTFSTFAFETSRLVQDSEWALVAGNVLGQNAIGVLGMFLGFAASRLL